jgi:hypothetical protein
MTVTAQLEPARAAAAPGGTSHFVLHVRNDGGEPTSCTLRAETEVGGPVTFEPESLSLAPGEISHIAVSVVVRPTTPPGPHLLTVGIGANGTAPAGTRTERGTRSDGADVEHDADDGAGRGGTTVAVEAPVATATATIDVEEVSDHGVALRPDRSRSSRRGRHQVVVLNRGNVPVSVAFDVEVVDGLAVPEPSSSTIVVEPGESGVQPVVLSPADRFDRGPSHVHTFRVTAAGSDGKDDELTGAYEQLPRLQRWHVIAAWAVIGGLLLVALVWFALLRPAIEDIASDEAETALAEQQATIDQKIAELDASAAEAEELPLGVPTDLRLEVEAATGEEDDDVAPVANGTVLSITDVVFQNPTGAIGTVDLLRDDEVLLSSELANFRDLDLHFVSPFRFEPGSTVALRVTCEEPGPTAESCVASATLLGFEDQAS